MFFAYHKTTSPTGSVIGSALQIPFGSNPEDGYDQGNAVDFLIRWGTRKKRRMDEQYPTVLNKCEAIEKASDKLLSLSIMREAGVNVPNWAESLDEAIEEFGYPLLGRTINHARGTDINLILQRADARRQSSDYFLQYIPTVREFRIHVVRDKVIRVQGKFLDKKEEAVSHIRNYSTGYRFRSPRRRLRSERLNAAVTAVKSLGLDFGAVDLIIAEDGAEYILEVNTAPSCSPITAAQYVVEFAKILDFERYGMQVDISQLDMLNPYEERDTEDEIEDDE